MVIDSSAIIAIVNLEPEAMHFVEAVRSDHVRLMSVVNRFEVFIAASRHPNAKVLSRSDDLIRELCIHLEPVLESQIDLARRCWEQFGKGRHRASLNFGDCFAYVLSQTSGEPLLFKGNDFAQTDVKKALEA